jgi:phosphopantothenate synthetase
MFKETYLELIQKNELLNKMNNEKMTKIIELEDNKNFLLDSLMKHDNKIRNLEKQIARLELEKIELEKEKMGGTNEN